MLFVNVKEFVFDSHVKEFVEHLLIIISSDTWTKY